MNLPLPDPCSKAPSRLTHLAAAALTALGLAGCATPAGPGAPGAPAAGPAGPAAALAAVTAVAPAAAPASAVVPAASSAAPAARPEPPPRPFAEVVKDARREDGFIPIWRKDEKVWLELAPARLGQPLLVSVNVASSVGERGLYASQMGPRWLAEFRRVGNQMQLVARQTGFRGERDPALARAVREAFSDSLIGSTPVASAAHPERKSVLVDASFLLGDMAGYSTLLEQAFRLPFTPDRANSFFEDTRAEDGLTTLAARVHFAVPRIPAPPLLPPGAPHPLTPPPPATTPDPRSLFVGFVYNFYELPAQALAPRLADPRVGHFIDSFSDLSDDFKPNPRVHHIRRWRLEAKEPQAALSEPVRPITYWLDRNIPARYRSAVAAGILEWNKAFERIGFKNAIVARQQPDDANFDTMDAAHASIRWFVGADVGFAIGPSHTDPRTGEIFDADIGMSDVFGRGARRTFRDDVDGAQPAWPAGLDTLWGQAQGAQCSYALEAAEGMHFALDLLEARGELDPDSPETEAIVQTYVKNVITHEVGHTLGLRHNFKASTTITREQLKDQAFGSAHGISGSVMDYNPFNLALAGEQKGELVMSTLGAYDYWAIEYAYKPIAAAQEAAELQKIAGRSSREPELAFADDADADGGGGNGGGLDPLANRFDLGDDPLAWYQRRFTLSKELWQRVQQRGAKPGDDPERQRRSLLDGFRQIARLPGLAAKYVGGMHTERDLPGSGGRPSFRPVEPAQQRQALRFLTEGLFSTDSFRFKPEFLSSLSPDYVEWTRSGPVNVPQAVLQLQTQALDRLLAPGTAQRLLDLPNYLPEKERRGAISLNELYTTLQSAVWRELKSGGPIEPLRRSLQREHLKRVQALLTHPPATLPADAVSLARLHASALQGELRTALARGGLAVENRAHLQDSLALVTEALRATLQRS